MNWIDIALLVVLGVSAIRGFSRGFIIEACGLIGLILGIWGGLHLNDHVARWLELDPGHEAVSFLITFVIILVLVHLLGRILTKVIDLAQLSLPNKVAGTLMGVVRSAFVLSVVLNILFAMHERSWAPSLKTMETSALAPPLRTFAPALVPALGGTKWVKNMMEELEHQIKHEQP